MKFNAKEKLLKIASWLYNTGLNGAMNRTEDAEELKDLWTFFIQTNGLLIAEAKDWKEKFEKGDKPLFDDFEVIPYPTEIACIIRILGINAEDIFEDVTDLQKALKSENKPVCITVANLMKDKSLLEITAEDIFSK